MLVEMPAITGGGGGPLLFPFYKGSPSGQELFPFCVGTSGKSYISFTTSPGPRAASQAAELGAVSLVAGALLPVRRAAELFPGS